MGRLWILFWGSTWFNNIFVPGFPRVTSSVSFIHLSPDAGFKSGVRYHLVDSILWWRNAGLLKLGIVNCCWFLISGGPITDFIGDPSSPLFGRHHCQNLFLIVHAQKQQKHDSPGTAGAPASCTLGAFAVGFRVLVFGDLPRFHWINLSYHHQLGIVVFQQIQVQYIHFRHTVYTLRVYTKLIIHGGDQRPAFNQLNPSTPRWLKQPCQPWTEEYQVPNGYISSKTWRVVIVQYF